MTEHKHERDYYPEIVSSLREWFPSLRKMKSVSAYRLPFVTKIPDDSELYGFVHNTRSIEFDIIFFNSKRAVNFEVKVCRSGGEYTNLAQELDVRSDYCDKNYAIFVSDGCLASMAHNIAGWNPFYGKSGYGCLVYSPDSKFKLFSLKGAQTRYDEECKQALLANLRPLLEQTQLIGKAGERNDKRTTQV